MRRKAREYALQILYALDLNPVDPRDFMKVFWEIHPARAEAIEYAQFLVEGTLKKKDAIDTMITRHSSNWKIKRMAVTDRNILRLASFELMAEDWVPARVVLNEAIEIAKKYGTTDSATFINGVLDSIHQEIAESQKSSQPVS